MDTHDRREERHCRINAVFRAGRYDVNSAKTRWKKRPGGGNSHFIGSVRCKCICDQTCSKDVTKVVNIDVKIKQKFQFTIVTTPGPWWAKATKSGGKMALLAKRAYDKSKPYIDGFKSPAAASVFCNIKETVGLSANHTLTPELDNGPDFYSLNVKTPLNVMFTMELPDYKP